MRGGDFFVGNCLARKFLAYRAVPVYNMVDMRSLRRRFTMGREFELKFSATPQQQASLACRFGEFSVIAMETTYYDTPDRALSDRRITLRRRLENGVSICTVKTPAENGGMANDTSSVTPPLLRGSTINLYCLIISCHRYHLEKHAQLSMPIINTNSLSGCLLDKNCNVVNM